MPVFRSMLRLVATILLLSQSGLPGLESVYFEVYPNADLYGAMGKVEGTGIVEHRAKDPWYIKDMTAVAVGNPAALVLPPSFYGPSPCDPDAYKVFNHPVAVNPYSTTNTEMIIRFRGKLITCGGSGGSGGDLPEFQTTIVHADLDVDSDNDSEGRQKPPSGSDPEDNMEDDPGLPGVYLCVNRNRDEIGSSHEGEEDYLRPGILESDPSLVRAHLTIKPRSGRATFSYDQSAILLYREGGKLIPSGVPEVFPAGVHILYIEGISVGDGAIDMVFKPDEAQGTVFDSVRYTVLDVVLEQAPDLYLADSDSWFPYMFRIDGLKSDDVVTVTGGWCDYHVDDSQFLEQVVIHGQASTPLRSPRTRKVNGEAREYIGVIPERRFNDLSTDSAVVGSVYLHMRYVNFRVNGTQRAGVGGSQELADRYFGDATIEAVEFGRPEKVRIQKAATRQDRLQNQATIQVLKHTTVPPTELDPDQTPLGWDAMQADAEDRGNGSFILLAQLTYSRFFFPGVIARNEVRVLDQQRGIYCVAYYNRVEPSSSGFGRPVVGQVPVLEGKAEFCKNASITAWCEQETASAPVLLDMASAVISEAEAWLPLSHPIVDHIKKITPYLISFLDAIPAGSSPPEYISGSVATSFGRVEDTTSPDPEALTPRYALVEVESPGTQRIGATLAARDHVPPTEVQTTIWSVGNMYQAAVSTSVTVRANAERFGSSNNFIAISVRTGTAALDVDWATIFGPDRTKIYGE